MIILAGCPYQVEVKGEDHTKGPYKNHRSSFGTYTFQNGEIHGRDWYKKGDHVISYCGKNWNVAQGLENLGKCQGGLNTSDDDFCPHSPGYTWKYYVYSISEWIDAGRHMTIVSAS